MSQAKSNKMGVVQLTILTMVNMMAGDSRRLNGTGMGIRKMRYVQP